MSEEKTKEQEVAAQKGLEQRVKGFNEELLPLLSKYKVGLTALPLLNGAPMPEDFRQLFNIQAKPHLFDDSKPESKVESAPANAEEGKKEPGEIAAA